MNDIYTEQTLYTEPLDSAGLSPQAQYQGLDYVNSDDAMEIDMGIRNTIMGIRLSILTMGLGLAKI